MIVKPISTLIATLVISVNSLAATQEHWGTAIGENGSILYKEHHRVTYNGSSPSKSITDYYAADGKTKIATLESDYSVSLQLPAYTFTDHRSSYQEGGRHTIKGYEAFYKEQGEKEQRALIEQAPSLFSGQGWHYYLVNRLETLEKDGVDLNLVLPGRLDYYGFQVTGSKSSAEILEAELYLDNWFLRLFAPSLTLTYHKKLKKLIRYDGPTNIADDKGDYQEVAITYDYDSAKSAPKESP